MAMPTKTDRSGLIAGFVLLALTGLYGTAQVLEDSNGAVDSHDIAPPDSQSSRAAGSNLADEILKIADESGDDHAVEKIRAYAASEVGEWTEQEYCTLAEELRARSHPRAATAVAWEGLRKHADGRMIRQLFDSLMSDQSVDWDAQDRARFKWFPDAAADELDGETDDSR